MKKKTIGMNWKDSNFVKVMGKGSGWEKMTDDWL